MNARRNLLALMNLHRFADVTRTSDGYYLAMEPGDCGFNAFLGKPSKPHPGPGRDLMLRTWNALSEPERAEVVALASSRSIPLAADFGVPVEA